MAHSSNYSGGFPLGTNPMGGNKYYRSAYQSGSVGQEANAGLNSLVQRNKERAAAAAAAYRAKGDVSGDGQKIVDGVLMNIDAMGRLTPAVAPSDPANANRPLPGTDQEGSPPEVVHESAGQRGERIKNEIADEGLLQAKQKTAAGALPTETVDAPAATPGSGKYDVPGPGPSASTVAANKKVEVLAKSNEEPAMSAEQKLIAQAKISADAVDSASAGLANKDADFYRKRQETDDAKDAYYDAKRQKRDARKQSLMDTKHDALAERLRTHYKVPMEEMQDLSYDRLKEMFRDQRRMEKESRIAANPRQPIRSAGPAEYRPPPTRVQMTARSNKRLKEYEIGQMATKHGVGRKTAELMLAQKNHRGLNLESPMMTTPDITGRANAMNALTGSDLRHPEYTPPPRREFTQAEIDDPEFLGPNPYPGPDQGLDMFTERGRGRNSFPPIGGKQIASTQEEYDYLLKMRQRMEAEAVRNGTKRARDKSYGPHSK